MLQYHILYTEQLHLCCDAMPYYGFFSANLYQCKKLLSLKHSVRAT